MDRSLRSGRDVGRRLNLGEQAAKPRGEWRKVIYAAALPPRLNIRMRTLPSAALAKRFIQVNRLSTRVSASLFRTICHLLPICLTYYIWFHQVFSGYLLLLIYKQIYLEKNHLSQLVYCIRNIPSLGNVRISRVS